MKNFLLLKTAIALCFLTLGGWTLAAKPNTYQNADQKSEKEAARDLYVKNCARCHGADGKSETNLGKSLEAANLTERSVQKMSEGKITNTITGGADNMPAFEKKLSAAEIKSIARYVKTLK